MRFTKLFESAKFCILFLLVQHISATGEESDSFNCGPISVNCTCGTGNTLSVKTVEVETLPSNVSEKDCSYYRRAREACADVSCRYPRSTDEMRRNDDAFFYPNPVRVHHGAAARVCPVPQLKRAKVKCHTWVSWVNCDITCIYGHAFEIEEGRSVDSINIHCRVTENRWTPYNFSDCQPFLNCKAHLVRPGNVHCSEPLDKPGSCEIGCHDYDDYHPAVDQKRYVCTDENFGDTLPHCAALDSTEIKLISRPGKNA